MKKAESKKIVSKEYELHFPHPGWSEQKPEDWYSQSMEGIKEIDQRMLINHRLPGSASEADCMDLSF